MKKISSFFTLTFFLFLMGAGVLPTVIFAQNTDSETPQPSPNHSLSSASPSPENSAPSSPDSPSPENSTSSSPASSDTEKPASSRNEISKEIQQLIQKLGDPSWKIRDLAARRLVEIGADAEKALLAATENDDPTISAAASYYHSLITGNLSRSTDPPEIKQLLHNYSVSSVVQKLELLEGISQFPKKEASDLLLRIITSDREVCCCEYAVLLLLWNLPENVTYPSITELRQKQISVKKLTSQNSSEQTSTEKTETNLEYWKTVNDWIKKRHDSVTSLLDQIMNDFPQRNSSLNLLINYLNKEQDILNQILQDIKTEKNDTFAVSGKQLRNTFFTLIHTQVNHIPQKNRSLNIIVRIGFTYYVADLLAQLGYETQGNNFLTECHSFRQLSHSSVQHENVVARFHSLSLRLSWISKLTQRGRILWTVSESELLWQNCPAPEIPLITSFMAEIYHTLGNDKRAAELLSDILTNSMKLKGFLSIRREELKFVSPHRLTDAQITNELAAQALFYKACHAGHEKDLLLQKKLILDSLAKDPLNVDALILAHEMKSVLQDSQWNTQIDEKLQKAFNEFKLENAKDFSESLEDIHRRNQYAWLAAKTDQNLITAAKYAEQNVKVKPDNSSLRDTLAHVYFAAGHMEAAILHQKRAISDAPISLPLRYHLEIFEAEKKCLTDIQNPSSAETQSIKNEETLPIKNETDSPQNETVSLTFCL
ncbi:MAG: hypothetical protein Q4C96_02490 [Planctomycetia bacterium]|nr:hypothetical protein [Planctomycetia bacterium]